jgi:hypothetical protein
VLTFFQTEASIPIAIQMDAQQSLSQLEASPTYAQPVARLHSVAFAYVLQLALLHLKYSVTFLTLFMYLYSNHTQSRYVSEYWGGW